MLKILKAIIIKKSGAKTWRVSVNRLKTHRLYKKQYKVTKNYLAHDDSDNHKVGDIVEIIETKPISRNKRFKIKS